MWNTSVVELLGVRTVEHGNGYKRFGTKPSFQSTTYSKQSMLRDPKAATTPIE